ncbi:MULTISPECIES: DUF4411 family protein [unclassified Mesorhizobium]|uniref:DUF4411 family protein n=1 Tax=unclassified Mesorhizobium TaxID=325217 RepID=UPI003337727D
MLAPLAAQLEGVTIYLLDANVLITAKNSYYAFDRVPEFWDWLLHWGEQGAIKIPVEILEEIVGGTDDLAQWLGDKDNKNALCLEEEADVGRVQDVLANGYAHDLTDAEIIKIGRDPFLISYAMFAPDVRTVITTEVSKPAAQRANRRIPDVCNQMHVVWGDSFLLVRELNFSTKWRDRV